VLLMESLVILTAIAIVKEKERGTIEQISSRRSAATNSSSASDPLHRPRLHQRDRGDPASARTGSTSPSPAASRCCHADRLFILTCLGMGLVVSAISETQQQASMAGQFVILPNMFFSGFMFPISSMPPLVQKLTYVIPLRYYIGIVRGIFLKGAGWAELRDEAAILLVYGVIILSLATLLFPQASAVKSEEGTAEDAEVAFFGPLTTRRLSGEAAR
jgi:ABC-2 type transport system permease protein